MGLGLAVVGLALVLEVAVAVALVPVPVLEVADGCRIDGPWHYHGEQYVPFAMLKCAVPRPLVYP